MTVATEKRERPVRALPNHLSHSRLSRYALCPEQYRLHYIERLRPRVPSANLVFGSTLHEALRQHFEAGVDPVAVFRELWDGLRDTELTFSRSNSWEKLQRVGEGLLEQFCSEERGKIGRVVAVERSFTLHLSEIDVPFVGIVDLVAEVNGTLTVIDFKTSASRYAQHEAMLSDQLTAYHLAETPAQQSALCVFVKTKQPRIEWHFACRTPEQLVAYLDKVRNLSQRITAGEFYKKPGMWCSWCDFLPVCLGDRKRVRETLVQIEPAETTHGTS